MAPARLGMLTAVPLVGGMLCWIGPRPGLALATVRQPQAALDRYGADAVAVTMAGMAGWIVLAWVVLACVLVAASALPGAAGRYTGALARVAVPAAVRRAIAAALGFSLATGLGLGAAAATTDPVSGPAPAGIDQAWPRPTAPDLDWPTASTGSAAVVVTAGSAPPVARTPAVIGEHRPLLARAAGAMAGAAAAGGTVAAAAGATVTVRPGDTLWGIAAGWLGPGATDRQIAAAWPRWYAANRRIVGPDPDRIFPGQRFVPPPPHGGTPDDSRRSR